MTQSLPSYIGRQSPLRRRSMLLSRPSKDISLLSLQVGYPSNTFSLHTCRTVVVFSDTWYATLRSTCMPCTTQLYIKRTRNFNQKLWQMLTWHAWRCIARYILSCGVYSSVCLSVCHTVTRRPVRCNGYEKCLCKRDTISCSMIASVINGYTRNFCVFLRLNLRTLISELIFELCNSVVRPVVIVLLHYNYCTITCSVIVVHYN